MSESIFRAPARLTPARLGFTGASLVGSAYLHFLVHSTSVPDELEDELEDEDELLLDEEEPPPEELDPVPLEEVVPEELVVVPPDVLPPPEELVPEELVVVPLDELVVPLDELVVPPEEEPSPLELDVVPLDEPVPEEELVVPPELLEVLEVVPPDEEEPPELLLATAWVERSFAVFSKAVSSAVPSWASPTIAAMPTTAAMRAYSTDVTPSSAVKMRSMIMDPGELFVASRN